MNTFKKQRGLSMLAWLVIVAMSGVLFLTALKLFPVYMEYYNILGIIEQTKQDPSLKNAPKDKVLSALHKRVGLADLVNVKTSDYTVTKIPGRNAYSVDLYYEVRTPLFGNLSIVAEFERSEEVGE